MAQKISLKQHIRELRIRLMICVIFFAMATTLSMIYVNNIYVFLIAPLARLLIHTNVQHTLIFTHITEGFFTQLRISIISGIWLSSPIWLSQVYFFIAPGLYKREKAVMIQYIILAPTLFVLGSMFAYYIAIPQIWKFFLTFEKMSNFPTNFMQRYQQLPLHTHNTLHTPPLMLYAKISEYLDAFLDTIVGFGLAFQLPIVITLLAKVGIIHYDQLKIYRKYAIVGIFGVAAILTPPDVLSQILMAVPMLMLYEIAIIICRLQQKNRSKNTNTGIQ